MAETLKATSGAGRWARLLPECADTWSDDDGPLELRPLPPDPLSAEPSCQAEFEPPWLQGWLEANEQGLEFGEDEPPEHLPCEMVAATDPGQFLLAELEAIDPRQVDEYHVVEMIAGYHRIASWAQSRMTELAGHLSRRPALNPRGARADQDYTMNVTAEELAPRLGISRFAARRIVDNSRLFSLKLEDTGVALRQGRIDYAKACTIARLLQDQPDDVAWEVQQAVLPDAGFQTVTQLERAIAKAIISIDPLRATARHKRAREQRKVHHPRPLPDGMASIFAVLPATDAAGLDLALEAAARTAKASGDSRTVDQLRADALALLGHGALENGFIGVPQEPVGATEPSAGGAEDASTAAAAADVEPSAPASPADASGAGDDDPDATEMPMLDTGNAFLRTPRMAIGSLGGCKAQVKVTVPLSVLVPLDAQDASGRCEGDSCAQHEPSGSPPDGAADLPDPDGLPEDWYYGPPAEVAELEGYGPITPDVARALAHRGGTWQRLVTDPLSGALLDVGRTRYRPPAPLADFVRNRDGTCVRPGCSSPAGAAQLDHVVPWQFDGVTSRENLASLCNADHPTKTIGAFQLRHLGDGTFQWTTPSGHHYLRHRGGRVTPLRRGVRTVEGRQGSVAPAFGAEPPF